MAGPDDIAPSVNVEGTEDAAAKFAQLGDAGEEAFDKIAKAAEQVGNAADGIKKLADDGKEAFRQLSAAGADAFSKILESAMSGNFTGVVTHLFGELAGAFANVTQEAIAFVEAQASAAETMSNLASATGMTLGEIGGLRDAFASVGISTNGFERSVGRLAITIGREWSQIQQSVRTSADAQTGAMLQVETATFAVEKAYTSMGMALSAAGSSAKHDALAISEAAHSLRMASEALGDFALTSRQNSLSIESAELALTRARMNLAKDRGYAPSAADEKAMKLATDTLAVKEAELKLEESKTKKQKEALEMEGLALKVRSSKLALATAEEKAQEDAIKSSERIKDAAMGIDKAQLARSEAQEKSHEQDLKNLPKIAQEIDQVAQGHKSWSDVINHTEISAQNLTKALILSAKAGGEEPAAMDVFKKMAAVFKNMGDDTDSMNKKLEIVQQTMGAGFRAGQASAAQMLAVLERGPEALEKFMKEAEKFSKVKIGGLDLKDSYDQLKEFNSASSQLSTAFDQLKTRFAAVMATPLAAWFTEMKDSIYQPTGALRLLADVAGTLFGVVTHLVAGFIDGFKGIFAAINQVAQSLAKLFGVDPGVMVSAMVASFLLLELGLGGVATKLALIMGKMFAWTAIVGLVTTAVGDLVKAWALLPTWMGGGKGTYEEGKKVEEMGQAVTRAAAKMMGFDDKQLDEARKIFSEGKNQDTRMGQLKGVGEGILGDASGIKKLTDVMEKSTKTAEDNKQHIRSSILDDYPGGAKKDGADAAATKDSATQLSGAAGTQKEAASELSKGASQLSNLAAAFGTVIANIAHGRSPSDVSGGKAGGGKISGPGGPRDDTAGLFALSDGEFVVQSAAVSHYGEGLFSALNSLSVGGFASGGMAGGSGIRAPSVGGGPGGGASSVLNLTIDGEHFNGLKAPEHVASKLKTFAVGRQSSSAGKAPSWLR